MNLRQYFTDLGRELRDIVIEVDADFDATIPAQVEAALRQLTLVTPAQASELEAWVAL